MTAYYQTFDFQKVPLKGVVIEKSSTAPASPAVDQLWTDTSSVPHLVKIYDGSVWTAIGYVADGSITDAKIASGANIALSKLAVNPLARANHTGTQSASTISDFDTQVRTSRLDQLAPATSDLNLGGKKITNVGAPTAPWDAANKSYVDAARAGISVKDPVRVVANGNVNLASPGTAIDGVTLTAGDRFLAPDQSTASENGIYEFNGAGSAATRAYDAQPGDVEDGTLVAVAEGSAAGEQWIQTVGSGNQHWTPFSMGGQTYTASAPLTLSGNTFGLDTLSVADGGTGATDEKGARDNLFAAGSFGETVPAAQLPGGGASATVTHGLGTVYVGVFTTLAGSGARVELDWKVTGSNTVALSSEVALSGDVNVLVVGA